MVQRPPGYGFITCIDESELQGTDIFVHSQCSMQHLQDSGQGEYVSFLITREAPGRVNGGRRGHHAGALLCQTTDVGTEHERHLQHSRRGVHL
jgi:cold shock CspA family protein